MPEIVDIPVSDLLLSSENPRLSSESATQQETALEPTERQGEGLIKLAEHIMANGLDPTTLPAVVATGDRRKRYQVLEGNCRVLALRALETPALVSPALTPTLNRRLNELAAKYEKDPIEDVTVSCLKVRTTHLSGSSFGTPGRTRGSDSSSGALTKRLGSSNATLASVIQVAR